MPVVLPNQHCCHWLMAIRAAKYGDSMDHMSGVYGHWYWGHMRSPMNGCEDVGCYSRAIPRAPELSLGGGGLTRGATMSKGMGHTHW